MFARRRPIAIAALCLTLVAAGPAVRHTGGMFKDALHGTWTAKVVADGGAGKEHTDTLTFTLGDKFSSTEMTKMGFEPTSYNDRPSPIGVAASWTVTLKNKAGDTAVWEGNKAANEMTGTVVVTMKDGAPENYTFRAERK
jgi:hypothetical protein